MSKVSGLFSLFVVLALSVSLAGCGAKDKTEDKNATNEESNGGDAKADKIKENLAKLSDEDRTAAEKQKVCPVSGEPLGSMGKPVKITVKETDVFICCDSCEDSLTSDPDKYLSKLKQ